MVVWSGGIIWCLLGIARWFAIGTPVPLVRAGIGIKHDDAVIAVTVGDEYFIGFGIDFSVRRAAEPGSVGAAGLRPRLPICNNELSIFE